MTLSPHYHHEDIKAAIRKKFGSVAAFECARGLPASSVNDVFRGRTSRRTERAIAEEVGIAVDELFPRTRRRGQGRGVNGFLDPDAARRRHLNECGRPLQSIVDRQSEAVADRVGKVVHNQARTVSAVKRGARLILQIFKRVGCSTRRLTLQRHDMAQQQLRECSDLPLREGNAVVDRCLHCGSPLSSAAKSSQPGDGRLAETPGASSAGRGGQD